MILLLMETYVPILGSVDVDMKLDAKDGNANALYNGKIKLNDFDLGTFLNRTDLGKITVEANVKDGRSLSKENAKANVDLTIASFPFRGYEYKNLRMEGKIRQIFF